jgi:nucleotide-binding universal stress UspA family protein
MEIARISYTGIGGYPVDFSDIAEEIVKECKLNAQKLVEGIKEDCLKKGIKIVTGYVKEGEAEDIILSTAKNKHCDMIVMSTHGRSGIDRVLLGSVTEHVIRHAGCPVLAIHPSV